MGARESRKEPITPVAMAGRITLYKCNHVGTLEVRKLGEGLKMYNHPALRHLSEEAL